MGNAGLLGDAKKLKNNNNRKFYRHKSERVLFVFDTVINVLWAINLLIIKYLYERHSF